MPSPTSRDLQTLYMWGQGSPVQLDMQDYFASFARYGITAAVQGPSADELGRDPVARRCRWRPQRHAPLAGALAGDGVQRP
jgi:hypothetical protein